MSHILIIEPNHTLASQYKTYLSGLGHDIVLRSDAQAAIIAADKQMPDIIIMELLLTAHNGIEFLYELRSYSEWQNIPVIILSRISNAENGLTPKTIKSLGIAEVLYKPDVSLAKLAARIEAILIKS